MTDNFSVWQLLSKRLHLHLLNWGCAFRISVFSQPEHCISKFIQQLTVLFQPSLQKNKNGIVNTRFQEQAILLHLFMVGFVPIHRCCLFLSLPS